ncbi:MAG TPA: hypothetical protein VFS43_20475 [Polyangiaceae bacterium]|nr:hypothetical protein [Polyangiaceae bacterium]
MVLGALASLVCALCIGQSALAPVLGHGASTRSKLAEAERRAALSPDDPGALASLVDAYIEAREPGAALAALGRAPAAVVTSPQLGQTASLAYLEAGDVPRSLAVARGALERCADAACEPGDEARLRYRVLFTDALLEQGIVDPAADPVGAAGVARRTFRRASLAASD